MRNLDHICFYINNLQKLCISLWNLVIVNLGNILEITSSSEQGEIIYENYALLNIVFVNLVNIIGITSSCEQVK